ncbi:MULTISPECIES: hypothetical protein [Brevibacterium]|uniref:Uncharacterized protein n=1 Tax=Brevibacterium antiquum CNRZ 918 TaxID=1255637 RepID=A0A2H1KDA7_9MICO|nr:MULTISPECIES: hypothetical protein [Brevibacterium]SMX97751.1 hypothetical protein BANT918_02355 [Brevibacterium antiquum CNRZ 918]HCG55359.1 hypothetical protein [Brevibacterium sp.]
MTTVYARRRLIALWLPFIIMGMSLYLYSYTLSFTFNGLSLLGLGITWLGVFASAYDAGEDS